MAETITLSSKFQIVIPKAVREKAHWQAGEKLVPLVKGRQVTLVPLRPLEEMRGFIKGAKIGEVRDREDRL
ncbi:MAG: AbrB/MazE/SpoVT family DNA-binding domain-containing protein [Armatimonadota bacterium]